MEKAIIELADRLGIAASEALPYLLKYTIVDAILGIFCMLMVIGIGSLLFKIFWERSEQFDDYEIRAMARGAVTCLSILFLFFAIIIIFRNVSILIEPRGYLLSEALSKVTK